MTQRRLADELGYSVSWVSQVERGELPVDRVSVLDRLAVALGVEVIELTGQPYRHVRARALGMAAGRDADALDALLTAERLAPAHVHNRPMARELTADLLARARRANSGLASLARRMGMG